MYGLIFDNDGVMSDTEGPCAEASVAMFKALYGVDMREDDFTPYIGTGMVNYLSTPARLRGIDMDIDQAITMFTEKFIEIMESGRDISLPGVHTLIMAAHAHPDWKMAIATSTPGHKAEKSLKAARIDKNLFEAFIHGDLVTRQKPDPEIYHLASSALAVPALNAVVIEDSIEGIRAAKAADMKCIAVTNSFPAERLQQADKIVSSLEEVTLQTLYEVLGQST